MPIVSALVPCNVELDLMRAGILPDLALGNNIYRLREFETYEWWHRRSFAAPAVPHRHSAQLVFEGLDCLAHVWLNGVLVGEGVNALVPQRFDVTDALREGENDLVVRIRSAVLEGRQHVPTPLESALPCGFEFLPIRKAPHCYGWDIMPRAVSAGIWRNVYIQFLHPTHWRSVYWATMAVDHPNRSAVLFVDWDFTTDAHAVDDWRVRLRPTVEMLVDLNCNMVCCWGRNVYESEDFFNLYDRHGIMVWQDFALACGVYPDSIIPAVRREAEEVVRRFRNHPSLVLWCGNNEIDHTYLWSGPVIDPNTDRISREVLAAVVRQYDPFCPYLPSSPYVSPEVMRRGGDINLSPEQHLWGPRDDFKGVFYTRSLAHFVSDIGYHGCPERRTLEQFLDPGNLWHWQDNEQWLTHVTRPLPEMTDFNYCIPLMAN